MPWSMRQRNRTVVQEVIKSCLPFTSIGTPTFFLFQSSHSLEESTFLASSSPRFGTPTIIFFINQYLGEITFLDLHFQASELPAIFFLFHHTLEQSSWLLQIQIIPWSTSVSSLSLSSVVSPWGRHSFLGGLRYFVPELTSRQLDSLISHLKTVVETLPAHGKFCRSLGSFPYRFPL